MRRIWLISVNKIKPSEQADWALGEPSDKSDFSLHVWDSFSQEIRDLLFIFYGQKSLIYLKCSDFLPKKEEMCYFFIEKREKENKRRKKKVKIWEKFKKQPKKNLTIFRKEKNWVWHYWKVTAHQSVWSRYLFCCCCMALAGEATKTGKFRDGGTGGTRGMS